MKRMFAIIMIVVITALSATSVSALGTLPAANEQPRHIVCTELSEAARAYYHDDYRYEKLSTLSGAADASTGYTAMQNNTLFDALHTLMTQTHGHYTTYSGYAGNSLAYYWTSTDAVESSSTYVMFYSDVMADVPGIKLNREHIWPKSRASFGERKGSGGSDLHHLRPAVDTLNNAKSNHMFGDINGVYSSGVKVGAVNGETCYWVMEANDLFECKDDVKGDVARILLYVYCRWEQPNLYTEIEAGSLPTNDSDSTNTGVRVIESLDTLLQWCEEDPVDTWEMRRNDLVESVQGNRNVFIDYPEYAWQLFGRKVPDEMTTPTSNSRVVLLGDVDGDGEITPIDASALQRWLARFEVTSFSAEAADMDQDDDISSLDVTYIMRKLAGIG